MKINATADLNGKIIVQFETIDDADVWVFLQPNAFSTKYGTQGILENFKGAAKIKNGTFTVPTDWTVIVSFNPSIYDG